MAAAGPRFAAAVHELRSGRFDAALHELDSRQHGTAGLAPAASRLRARLRLLVGEFNAAANDFEQHRHPVRRALATRLAHQRRRALSLCERGRHAAAVDELDGLLRHARASVPLYLLRAECHLRLNDVRAAHLDASTAVALDPLDPSALLLLARVLYATVGLDPMPARSARLCTRVAPDDRACASWLRWLSSTNKSFARAHSFDRAGKFEEAVIAYDSVVSGHTELNVAAGTGAEEAMPRPLRKIVFGALCRLHKRAGNVAETLRLCQLVTKQLALGEADAIEQRDAAMAHLHCAWAHLEDSAGLGRAKYAARFAESLLKASAGAEDGMQELKLELRSIKARISQLEEQRAALQELDLYDTLGLAKNASNRDIRE
eukprot:4225693-Prymnesium_polylepis.1